MEKRGYIPACHFHFLTPIYQPVADFFNGGNLRKMTATIPFQPSQAVLDVACGPGTLLRRMYEKESGLKLTGLDIDAPILEIARKNTSLIPGIHLVEASATELPFAEAAFDIVTSSLAFHHLSTVQKGEAFSEIFRVLHPGGTFYLLDFAQPLTWWGKIIGQAYRWFEDTEDGFSGKLPDMFDKAGFRDITTHWQARGIISLLSGRKP